MLKLDPYKLPEINSNKYSKSVVISSYRENNLHLFIFFKKRKEKRSSHKTDMKFNFSNCGVVQYRFLSRRSSTEQTEYICSDKGEKLDLMCSRVGDRFQRYAGYIHCFWSDVYPRESYESFRSFSTNKTSKQQKEKKINSSEEHRAEIWDLCSPCNPTGQQTAIFFRPLQ